MKRPVLLLLFTAAWAFCSAQNLDRISLSSGGAATNEVNYVIGETFNFTLAEGDVIIETGSLGSEEDTGGDINYTQVLEIAINNPMECFPNPVIDFLTVRTGFKTGVKINLFVYNANGQVVYQNSQLNQNEIKVDLHNLSQGIYHLAIIENETKTLNAVKIVKQ
ncbi:MAG: T9SS type A sorting domain-containing protein [Clostridia bacterium]|nr:T9SS type A sorting domain-containing protein [Clostridia bacterium]